MLIIFQLKKKKKNLGFGVRELLLALGLGPALCQRGYLILWDLSVSISEMGIKIYFFSLL